MTGKKRIQLAGHRRNHRRPQRDRQVGQQQQQTITLNEAQGTKKGKKRCPGAVKMWSASVCAMKYGGVPTQPSFAHRSITALHQSITFVVPNATSLHWAHGSLYSLSCGRQVPDVDNPHYRDAAALPYTVSLYTVHRVGRLCGLSRSRFA